jgi:RimJ/RimL family protein N-acetyltransferase
VPKGSATRWSHNDDEFAGRGYTTEAVRLLVDWLFAVKKRHRIPVHRSRQRSVAAFAEKCGFVLEGTARGAFFNAGRNQDLLLYSLLQGRSPGLGTRRSRVTRHEGAACAPDRP